MTRQLISSGSPLEATYGYSRAVVQGDWCFVAGTTGPNPDGSGFSDSVVEQARNAFAIVEKAMEQAGFTLADVVRATYYITDAAYWQELPEVLGAVFGEIRPASSCIICGLVNPAMKFEVELTALKGA